MIVLAMLCVIVVLPVGALSIVAFSRMDGGFASSFVFVLGFLGLVLVSFLGWGLLRAFRAGAYLEGTELVARGALRRRRADLASAQSLRLTRSSSGWNARALIPTLDASHDAHGRSVTIHFGGHVNGFLPQAEVEALVRAISAGSRTGLPAQQAEHTIKELYLLAHGPFAR
ncbi:hypothetical protein [Amycolatopsis aidingensis]|uniref:hypothetical protein n=1 Tax=Amycolatopsis aidingensis TaxID=2842453 RepID=UPI001C0B3247|nr:hypothetical protein [Amycolatopsis aidingensis]